MHVVHRFQLYLFIGISEKKTKQTNKQKKKQQQTCKRKRPIFMTI